jgi:2-succinyl-5-enolpyruvyl-6-hydroxy-3-cyclohexene-1-carboxylate synthase
VSRTDRVTGAAADSATGCLNLGWSLALLHGMVSAGLERLVLSPGARSTPLLIAAQRLEAEGRLQLTPILDERSAGFFALGLARARLRPVALLATSGSAPAHWYPAVIEASEAGLPLLLLSADRPPRLRAWGANQTVDQTRLFGSFVREFHDPGLPRSSADALRAQSALGWRAVRVSLGKRPGPVHLNLPFDEPLVPEADCDTVEQGQGARLAGRDGLSDPAPHRQRLLGGGALQAHLASWPSGRGLIVCGPDADPGTPVSDDWSPGLVQALRRCAEALSLPVLVDPLSGLRTGTWSDDRGLQGAQSGGSAANEPRISRYDGFLRHSDRARALRPHWVLRLGRAPVSKVLGQWLAGVPAVLVGEAGLWSDPTQDAVLQLELPAAAVCDALREQGLVEPSPAWLAAWQAAERLAARLMEAAGPLPTPSTKAPERDPVGSDMAWNEAQVIQMLRQQIPDGEALFCGNSMPIRQLDTWWPAGEPRVALLGNRGVSGIDGYLSTLAGLCEAGLPCWGLVGDLSLCHDLSGLLLAARLQRPLLVLNNGGGHIFDYLPQRGLPDFERLWQTPQSVELAALAALAGLKHWRAADAASLQRALSEVGQGPGLIECLIDAEASRQAHLACWERLRTASFSDASER